MGERIGLVANVLMLTETSGTGTYALAAAAGGRQPLGDAVGGVAGRLYGAIVVDGIGTWGSWERGHYRYLTGPARLERVAVIEGSNGTSPVDWPDASVKYIILAPGVEDVPTLCSQGALLLPQLGGTPDAPGSGLSLLWPQGGDWFERHGSAAGRRVSAYDADGRGRFEGGMYVGGLGAANLLSLVEHGTFTPGFSYQTVGDLSNAYTLQKGEYLRWATWMLYLVQLTVTPTFTTAAGNALYTGLPYPVAAGSAPSPGLVSMTGAVTWSSGRPQVVGRATPGTTAGTLRCQGSGIADTAMTHGQFTSGVQYSFIVLGLCRVA